MNIPNPKWTLKLVTSTGEEVGKLEVSRNRCNSLVTQLWERYQHVTRIKIIKLNNATKTIVRP